MAPIPIWFRDQSLKRLVDGHFNWGCVELCEIHLPDSTTSHYTLHVQVRHLISLPDGKHHTIRPRAEQNLRNALHNLPSKEAIGAGLDHYQPF